MTLIELPGNRVTAESQTGGARSYPQGMARKAGRGIIGSRPAKPLKTGRAMLAKYGPVPSAKEIDEKRKDMFRIFGAVAYDDARTGAG